MPPVSEFESPKLYIAGKEQEGDESLSSTHFTQDRKKKNTTNTTLNPIFKVGSVVLLS